MHSESAPRRAPTASRSGRWRPPPACRCRRSCALSLLMFTGASQFAFIGLIGGGAAAAVATALLLGGRNALYGLRLAPYLRPRWLAAQFVIDESAAMAVRDTPADTRLGFWSTGLAVFVCWNAATLLGALGGQLLSDPRALGLDAAAPAAFLALLAPRLREREMQRVAGIAAVGRTDLGAARPGGNAGAGGGRGDDGGSAGSARDGAGEAARGEAARGEAARGEAARRARRRSGAGEWRAASGAASGARRRAGGARGTGAGRCVARVDADPRRRRGLLRAQARGPLRAAAGARRRPRPARRRAAAGRAARRADQHADVRRGPGRSRGRPRRGRRRRSCSAPRFSSSSPPPRRRPRCSGCSSDEGWRQKAVA